MKSGFFLRWLWFSYLGLRLFDEWKVVGLWFFHDCWETLKRTIGNGRKWGLMKTILHFSGIRVSMAWSFDNLIRGLKWIFFIFWVAGRGRRKILFCLRFDFFFESQVGEFHWGWLPLMLQVLETGGVSKREEE